MCEYQVREDGTVEIEGRKVRYIDPLTDWGFKRLFGSEVNKEILLGFLQDLFPEKDIRDIRYLNNENQGLTTGDRKAVFDVSCRTEKGEEFIVEMQKTPQEYFRDRALYYSTFPLQKQAPKGDWNFRLAPVYMVGILNFGLEHKVREEMREKLKEMLVFRYELLETTIGERMTDNLGFVFLEVGKFDKAEDKLESMMDKWMFTLKNMSRAMAAAAETSPVYRSHGRTFLLLCAASALSRRLEMASQTLSGTFSSASSSIDRICRSNLFSSRSDMSFVLYSALQPGPCHA